MSSRDCRSWSVVLPVYDEDPVRIRAYAAALLDTWDEVVIVADDPSSRLRSCVLTLGEDEDVLTKFRATRQGKGAAVKTGLNAATGDVVGYVDADGAVTPADLEEIYAAVPPGDAERRAADVAVGSRQRTGATDDSGRVRRVDRAGQPLSRRVLGTGYSLAAQLVSRAPVADFQCGAKAFTAEAWESVDQAALTDGFGIDTQLLNQFAVREYSFVEVPIDWRDPGDTSVDVTTAVPHMTAVLLSTLISTLKSTINATSSSSSDSDRLALVSSHPPNRGHLAEYGEELAQAYAEREGIEPVVHTNIRDCEVLTPTPAAKTVADEYDYPVVPSWKRDSVLGALTLFAALVTRDADVIHFNVHMTYFGDNNVHRFIGLLIPALLTLKTGTTVVTTLHDMLEIVNEDRLDGSISFVERIGATVATQLVLLSDVTTVTSEEYETILTEKYFTRDVRHVPHGSFLDDAPGESLENDADAAVGDGRASNRDGGVTHDILVFGYLDPTKDIGTAVDAYRELRARRTDVRLTIAGGEHPDYDGYVEQLESEYADIDGVEFTGYVPDDELDEIWLGATVLVMPYVTVTGVSGVFQLAKTYGVPVVAADIDGMRSATVETGGEAEFVEPDDPVALAARLDELLDSPARLADLGVRNREAADDFTVADAATAVLELTDAPT